MADPTRPSADVPADVAGISPGATGGMLGPDWSTEDAYWQSAYPERPYARADRSYEYYRDAYRYGVAAAVRHQGQEWPEVEQDLQRGWAAGAGDSGDTWEEMKDAVRDAWDHVRGQSDDDRTHIR